MDDTLAPKAILRNPESLYSLVPGALTDSGAFKRLLKVNWVPLAVDLSGVSKCLQDFVELALSSHTFGFIHPVLRMLVTNLKDTVYDSATELKKEVYTILRTHSFGEEITGAEETMLLELFRHHPKGIEKLRSFQAITIGSHREGDQETRCFCIRSKSGEIEEISYIKSVTALANHQSQTQDLCLFEKLQAAAEMSVDLLLSVLEENPLLHSSVVKLLVDSFPHMRMDLHVQKFYITNILTLSRKDHTFECAMVRLILNKLIRIDSEGDASTADCLLEVLLAYLQSHLSDTLFDIVLDVFEDLVLPTFRTAFVQVVVLFCCQEGRAEYLEKFASLLVTHLYEHRHVGAAAAYLSSLLAYFDSHILHPAVEFLLDYCLQSLQDMHFVTAAKYALYLLAARPSLLSLSAIRGKARRLLKSSVRFLECVPLNVSTDYSPVLALIHPPEELVREELYLPFDLDLCAMPCCKDYLCKTFSEDFSAKRRRGMSLDVTEPSTLKKRAKEVESCASSLDTSTPTHSG